jgi:flagellar basal-body rod protein FlgF
MSDFIIPQASSSINALMREYEIITNNLANVSTTGFKRITNAFSKSLEENITKPEQFSPGNLELNSSIDFSQGNISHTGRSLDFAISGKGFFVIETPTGPLYTRNGEFHTDQNNQIVDASGRIVAGDAGPITIPPDIPITQINVSKDGNISAAGVPIGKFRLVEFPNNEDKLVPTGDSCYQMSDKNIQPVDAENSIIKQGSQETSNVKMIDELVDMLMVTRLYEANMKFIAARKEIASSITSAAMA